MIKALVLAITPAIFGAIEAYDFQPPGLEWGLVQRFELPDSNSQNKRLFVFEMWVKDSSIPQVNLSGDKAVVGDRNRLNSEAVSYSPTVGE